VKPSYPSNANLIVDSFAKFLRDLEKPPVHSSRALFGGSGMTPLYEAVFEGKKVCMSSLRESLVETILAKPCLQLSACNLIIVLKTTSVVTCIIFGL